MGRRAEVAQLRRLLTGDAERAVVVTGEPGVGKTALIEQVCARAVPLERLSLGDISDA